jgi:hypothetical protein
MEMEMGKGPTRHRKTIAAFSGLVIIGLASLVGWFAWCARHTSASVEPIAGGMLPPDNVTTVLRPSVTDRMVDKDENRASYPGIVHGHVRRDKGTDAAMDVDVAIQAYQDTLTCRDYLHQINASLAKHASEDPDSPVSTLESTLENLDRASKAMERNRDLCAGETQESLDKKMVALSLGLGLKGYPPAQACFVEAPYAELDNYYRKNATLQEQYLANAPQFMTDLLINGDWATTMQAEYMLGARLEYGETQGKWLDQMPLPDPYLVYRSLRLAYYRYPKDPPDRLERFERSLQEFELKYRFSDEAVAEADAWAHEVYLQKYAELPPLNIDDVSGCSKPATPTP